MTTERLTAEELAEMKDAAQNPTYGKRHINADSKVLRLINDLEEMKRATQSLLEWRAYTASLETLVRAQADWHGHVVLCEEPCPGGYANCYETVNRRISDHSGSLSKYLCDEGKPFYEAVRAARHITQTLLPTSTTLPVEVNSL